VSARFRAHQEALARLAERLREIDYCLDALPPDRRRDLLDFAGSLRVQLPREGVAWPSVPIAEEYVGRP